MELGSLALDTSSIIRTHLALIKSSYTYSSSFQSFSVIVYLYAFYNSRIAEPIELKFGGVSVTTIHTRKFVTRPYYGHVLEDKVSTRKKKSLVSNFSPSVVS